MANPNFNPNVGRLGTDRYDFQNHTEGTAFRHNAIQTDVNPPVTINGASYITVADALNAISGYIVEDVTAGQGFVTVPDGYDTYHAANGTINFDHTVPPLDTFLNPLFQMIANAQAHLAGNPLPFPSAPFTLPPQYARIQYGGIVVIKAGMYIVKNMIQVPPGITILGEGYGTKIVNASALNTNVALPSPITPVTVTNASNTNPIQITTGSPHNLAVGQVVSVTGVNGNTNANVILAQITILDSSNFTLNGIAGNAPFTSSPNAAVYTNNPIFFILPDPDRSDNDTVVDQDGYNLFMFSRETRIMNLVLGDNFIEPTELGDNNYKLPQNHSNSGLDPSITLIYQQLGSSLTLDGIFGIGRVTLSGLTVTSVTTSLVESFYYPPQPNQNHGSVPPNGTILKIINSFIDGFAVPVLFDGLNGSKDFVNITNNKIRAYGYLIGDNTTNSNNTFISTSDANLNIIGNHFYGNDTNIVSVADINATVSGAPPALQAKSKVVASGNNIIIGKRDGLTNNTSNRVFGFYTYGSLAGTINQYITLSGRPIIVNTTPYNVDSILPIQPYENILLVDTTSLAITVNLPGSSTFTEDGLVIVIKDYKGHASAHNITIHPPAGVSIDGNSSDQIITVDFSLLKLISIANNWYILQNTQQSQTTFEIPFVSSNVTNTSVTYTESGARTIDFSLYPPTLGGLSRAVNFIIDTENTAGTTGVQFYMTDITDSVDITGLANIVVNSVGTPLETTYGPFTVNSSSGNFRSDAVKLYRLKHRIAGGTPGSDTATVFNARLIIKYS